MIKKAIEKIKKFKENHKSSFIIGGISLFALSILGVLAMILYRNGYNNGVASVEESATEYLKESLSNIAPDINKRYIIMRTGDFSGKTFNIDVDELFKEHERMKNVIDSLTKNTAE